MIIIYWATNTFENPEGIRAEPPVPILKKLIDERVGNFKDEVTYNRCPAVVDELSNVYGIKSYHDYTIDFGQGGLSSPDYDEEFFKRFISIDSWHGNLFQVSAPYVFFTDTPSLEVSFIPAYLEDNNVVNNTICIPAIIDIGKYFRGTSFAFHMKKNCKQLVFNRQEIYMYIKIHTKEKLQFKQFLYTEEMEQMDHLMMSAKRYWYRNFSKVMTLEYYYNIFARFNFKKKHLKLIKQNLCKDV